MCCLSVYIHIKKNCFRNNCRQRSVYIAFFGFFTLYSLLMVCCFLYIVYGGCERLNLILPTIYNGIYSFSYTLQHIPWRDAHQQQKQNRWLTVERFDVKRIVRVSVQVGHTNAKFCGNGTIYIYILRINWSDANFTCFEMELGAKNVLNFKWPDGDLLVSFKIANILGIIIGLNYWRREKILVIYLKYKDVMNCRYLILKPLIK